MGEILDQFDKVPVSQKVLLLLLLALGIFVAFYLLMYSTIEDEIQQATNRVTELSESRAALVANASDIERIRADIRELCSRQETFMEKLPPRAEIPSLLQSIHQQASLVGLEITQFSRGQDLPDISYTRIPVSMSLKGTYDQVTDFFFFIGRQQRIVNVSDITFGIERGPVWIIAGGSAAGAGDVPPELQEQAQLGPPLLNVSCVISTYFTSGSGSQGSEICESI